MIGLINEVVPTGLSQRARGRPRRGDRREQSTGACLAKKTLRLWSQADASVSYVESAAVSHLAALEDLKVLVAARLG